MKKLTNKTRILKISFFILAILVISGCINNNVQPINTTHFNNVTANKRVDIRSLFYAPPIVVIKNGTTVAWTNKDSIRHTITSTVDIFDSGSINQGSTYSHIFNKTGAFEYSCTIHKDMPHGIVIVTG